MGNLVIKEGASGEVIVKKSRFISELKYVETEEEAISFIKEKKKQYHDARHNCSCYIIGEDKLSKSSDDGEPSGTAGRPMLEVLEKKGLINVVAVVTRYFGGVLLGTGGLVRAYQDAIKDALDKCDYMHTIEVNELEMTLDYNMWPKIENYCKETGITIGELVFLENVKVKIKTPVEDTDRVIDEIIEITSGKCHIEKDDEKHTIFSD